MDTHRSLKNSHLKNEKLTDFLRNLWKKVLTLVYYLESPDCLGSNTLWIQYGLQKPDQEGWGIFYYMKARSKVSYYADQL